VRKEKIKQRGRVERQIVHVSEERLSPVKIRIPERKAGRSDELDQALALGKREEREVAKEKGLTQKNGAGKEEEEESQKNPERPLPEDLGNRKASIRAGIFL